MSRNRCELFQVTRIVGEKEVQVVERAACPVPECAQPVKKILDVIVDVVNTQDQLFTGKVVKEGVFQVQILFISCDDFVRYTALEIPFIAHADIPGARPGMQAQNQILKVEKVVSVETERPREGLVCEVFDIKIVVKILFRVLETVERVLEKCRRPQGQCFSVTSGCSGADHRRKHRC